MKPNSLIIASLALVASLLVLGTCFDAQADSSATGYYQYETENGSLAFGDDVDQIPERYSSSHVWKTWHALLTSSASKMSIAPDMPVTTWSDDGEPEVNPNHLNDCTGHITIVRQRFQIEEYSVVRFVTRDECGRVVSVTEDPPDIDLKR